MFIRTYIRTLFNSILNKNFIVKFLTKFVNFYCGLWFKSPNCLKFEQSLSINNMKKENMLFFQSVTGDKVDCK